MPALCCPALALSQTKTNEASLKSAEAEIKLHINTKLYEKGVITYDMYIKAKELILKG